MGQSSGRVWGLGGARAEWGGGVKRSYVVICMVAPISVVADLF